MNKADEALADEMGDSNKTERERGSYCRFQWYPQRQSLVITMETYIPENSEEMGKFLYKFTTNIKERRFKQGKQTHNNKVNKVARNIPTLKMSGSKGFTVKFYQAFQGEQTPMLSKPFHYTEGRDIVSNIL